MDIIISEYDMAKSYAEYKIRQEAQTNEEYKSMNDHEYAFIYQKYINEFISRSE